MSIPTEPIGSIPRSVELIDTALAVQAGSASPAEFEATGSPVVTDGEQRRFQSFWIEAAAFIPVAQLGTTDDCGFAPFSDDRSTSRATAFARIRARVQGTAMAAAHLGISDP